MKMTSVNNQSSADGIIYSDPGHAWLAVPLKVIKRLKLEKEITSYSYQNKGIVYLEEDCDLSTYLRKLEGNGMTEFKYYEIYQENTPIRNYQHFNNAV